MDRRALLAEHPVLSLLPDGLRDFVSDSFVEERFGFGSEIVREGDPADALYVLASGRARVVRRGESGDEIALGRLKAGDHFGEIGLLDGGERSATVRASGDVEALRLDRSVFEAMVKSHPEIRTFFELQIRHRALSDFFRIYSPFAGLPVEGLRWLLGELEEVSFERGELVVQEGEPADCLYVINEGQLRVFQQASDAGDEGRHYLSYMRKGEFFGEVALLRGGERSASVEAASDCTLLRLSAKAFGELLEKHPELRGQLEERIAQYDYKQNARVPLDFAEEALPSVPSAVVGDDQVQAEASAEADERSERGAFESDEGFFRKRKRRIRSFPHVFQIDEMDCGSASLAMVCRHYGRNVSLSKIRQLLHVSTDGTSLRALVDGAERLGLAARTAKVSAANVLEMPLPAILHWGGNHWVVLYDVDEKHARIADPGMGLRRVPRAVMDEEWTGYTALFDYTEDFKSAPETQTQLSWLYTFIKPQMPLILRGAGLALVMSFLQMLFPVFSQVVVDRVLVDRDLGLLNMMMLAMTTTLLFMLGAVFIQGYLMSFATVRIDAATLDYVTRRMLALPTSYFGTRRTGDIQRRLESVSDVRAFIVGTGMLVLSSGTELLAVLALMAVYSPIMLACFFGVVPLYLGLMIYSSKSLRPLFGELEEKFARYQSHQIDAIKGIETVKAVAGERSFREDLIREFQGISRTVFDSNLTIMRYQGAVELLGFFTSMLFLWVGALQVMDGNLTLGGFVAFQALVAMALAPLGQALGLWDDYQQVQVLVNRLADIFEHEPEQGLDHSNLRAVQTLEGRVQMRGVGFRYGGSESDRILHDIDLDVPAGKMVAICGRSGSGKTTLVRCLSGLLEPTEGTILYDGVDLKTLRYRDLRRLIGFVPQESYLFDDSIARNIAYGDGEPDMEKVIWAARVAAADGFIERLPMGYDSRVGETGLAISGGQRQRLSIARAVYQRPPLLILDEATSSLDTESERAVQENFERLLAGRTSFVIAHRMSTVQNADLIIVLEKGTIAEQGSHEELMQRQGLYYYLVSQQLGL